MLIWNQLGRGDRSGVCGEIIAVFSQNRIYTVWAERRMKWPLGFKGSNWSYDNRHCWYVCRAAECRAWIQWPFCSTDWNILCLSQSYHIVSVLKIALSCVTLWFDNLWNGFATAPLLRLFRGIAVWHAWIENVQAVTQSVPKTYRQ